MGLHLTLDLSNCNIKQLTNIDLVYNLLLNLPKTLGMKTITLPYVVKWLDQDTTIAGISGFTMIAESHISIHTFPEKRFTYADVFSCRNFHINRTIELFTKTFEAKHYTKQIIKRGA